MTTLNPPPTFPLATDLCIMKACKSNPSSSTELIDDVEDANAYQCTAKDCGKLNDSKEELSNMDCSTADIIEFDELLQSVMHERDDELVNGDQVATKQEPKDDNRESNNEQKSQGVVQGTAMHRNNIAVRRNNTASFSFKRILSFLKWNNGHRRISDKADPKEVKSHNDDVDEADSKEVQNQNDTLDSNAVAAGRGSQSQSSRLNVDIGITSDRKEESTDTEPLNSEYDSDCRTSSERCFGEIVSVTESYEISAPNLDASLLDGHIEGGSLAAEHDSYSSKGSEIYYRDAVTSVDSRLNFPRRLNSSLTTDENVIGTSASKYDSDDEHNSERHHGDVVTLIDSTDNSMPELHPSLLNSLPPIEGLPSDEYESDYENSSEHYFGEVVTLEESDSSSGMGPSDSALFVENTEAGETATEKKHNLVVDKNSRNSDAGFEKKGKTSFDKNIDVLELVVASERQEEFKDIGRNMKRVFEAFESLLEVKSTHTVFAMPGDKLKGDKIAG